MSDTPSSPVRGFRCPDCRGWRAFERLDDGYQCAACGLVLRINVEAGTVCKPAVRKKARPGSIGCPECPGGPVRTVKTYRKSPTLIIRYHRCQACGSRFGSVQAARRRPPAAAG